MKTITIQIGNSDGKLNQKQWANFVCRIYKIVTASAHQIHFFGGSSNWETWQNAAWIFDCHEGNIPGLKEDLIRERKVWLQDSVGYMEGETLFL